MEKIGLNQEMDMIFRGNHEEIMAYINKYLLNTEAEMALIKRGNSEEINAMNVRKNISYVKTAVN